MKPSGIDGADRRKMEELRDLQRQDRWPELEIRLVAGLRDDPGEFLSLVRHAGLFRPSAVSFDLSQLQKSIASCRAEHAVSSPSDIEGQIYFQSLAALCEFAPNCERELKRVRRILLDDPAGSIMGMAGELGLAFLSAEDSGLAQRYNVHWDPEPVALADGFSLAVHMLREAGRPVQEFLGLMDMHTAGKGKYRALLEVFVALQTVRECEVLIDRLGFVASVDQGGWLSVSAPDARLGKALAHGFATYLVAQFAWAREFESTTKSLRAAVKEHLPKDQGRIAWIEGKRLARLRVEIPMPLIEALGSVKTLLPEEAAIAASESVGSLADPEELLALEIAPGLTAYDLLVGQRVLRLASVLVLEGLVREPVQPRVVVLRSVLPTFSLEGLTKAVEPALGSVKARAFCEFLLEEAAVGAQFDILYQPAFGTKEALAVPLPVAHHANMIRNGLKRWRGRPVSLHGPTLESRLERLLLDAGALAAKGVKVSGKDVSGEVDVLALVDGVLFMFECKSGLFPGGILELQPVLDQLEKGSLQLLRLSDLIRDPNLRATLLRSLKWEAHARAEPTVSAVISNTRMLAGSSPWGVPIHSWLELENYVALGTVRLGEESVVVRNDGPISAEDLAAFIGGARLHDPLFDCLRSGFKERRLGKVGVRSPDVLWRADPEGSLLDELRAGWHQEPLPRGGRPERTS